MMLGALRMAPRVDSFILSSAISRLDPAGLCMHHIRRTDANNFGCLVWTSWDLSQHIWSMHKRVVLRAMPLTKPRENGWIVSTPGEDGVQGHSAFSPAASQRPWASSTGCCRTRGSPLVMKPSWRISSVNSKHVSSKGAGFEEQTGTNPSMATWKEYDVDCARCSASVDGMLRSWW